MSTMRTKLGMASARRGGSTSGKAISASATLGAAAAAAAAAAVVTTIGVHAHGAAAAAAAAAALSGVLGGEESTTAASGGPPEGLSWGPPLAEGTPPAGCARASTSSRIWSSVMSPVCGASGCHRSLSCRFPKDRYTLDLCRGTHSGTQLIATISCTQEHCGGTVATLAWFVELGLEDTRRSMGAHYAELSQHWWGFEQGQSRLLQVCFRVMGQGAHHAEVGCAPRGGAHGQAEARVGGRLTCVNLRVFEGKGL